jgi:hypothetical protein
VNPAETMTLVGVLYRSKRRKHDRDWWKDLARMTAEGAGLVPTRYEKETGYVSGETLNTTGRGHNVWSLASLKAFDGIASGTRVRFKASVRRWDNGGGHSLGGDCSRVRDVEVLPSAPEAA